MPRTPQSTERLPNAPFDMSRFIAKWKTLSVGRRTLLVVIVAVGVVSALAILGASLTSLSSHTALYKSSAEYDAMQYRSVSGGTTNSAHTESARAPSVATDDMARSYLPEPMPDPYVPGPDAEDFEIQSFAVYIESNTLSTTCATIDGLKPNPNVVFEYAQAGEKNCEYRFKVAHDSLPEVLGYLQALNPKELTQSTESVKRQVDDFIDRRDILMRTASSVESVLEDAIDSFDALTALAQKEGNADALARSITKKIELIDQLRSRREMIRNQLDALNRAEAELRDRMKYVTFTVSVREVVYIDSERMRDSWRTALQQFVTTSNELLQLVTVGLLSFILYLAVFAIYGFLLLLVLKFGWRIVRTVWRA